MRHLNTRLWCGLVAGLCLLSASPAQAAAPALSLDRAALDTAMQPAGPRAQLPFSGIVLVAQQGKLLWNYSSKNHTADRPASVHHRVAIEANHCRLDPAGG